MFRAASISDQRGDLLHNPPPTTTDPLQFFVIFFFNMKHLVQVHRSHTKHSLTTRYNPPVLLLWASRAHPPEQDQLNV